MNLTITNQTCEDIIFNGHYLEKLYFGNDLVWEKQHGHDYSQDYFTIESLENGNTITLTRPYDPVYLSGIPYISNISWSKDKINWTTTVADRSAQTAVITVNANAGEKVYWKSDGWYSRNMNDPTTYITFSSTKTINVSGNILSLVYEDNFAGVSGDKYKRFAGMFYENTKLINAINLILSTEISTSYSPFTGKICANVADYANMFNGCTNLISAPELQDEIIRENTYYKMFMNCTSLVNAPTQINVTTFIPDSTFDNTFAKNCCESMFEGCTSLTSAPLLKTSTLSKYCYKNMFKGCTSLVNAPVLLSNNVFEGAYYGMFEGCTSLVNAPELLSMSLATYCYYAMFRNCTSLKYIKCWATSVSANYCTTNWVSGVGATGTFYKHPSMRSWSTGNDGIPSGWTVINAS